MFNHASNNKRFGFVVILFLLIICFCPVYRNIAFANDDNLEEELNNNIDSILDDIDFSSLDDSVYSIPDINFSFKDFVINLLNGKYEIDYNSVFDYIKSNFLNQIENNLRFFVMLFVIIFLYEIFKSFSESKFEGLNSSLKIVFSFLLATSILLFVKSFFSEIQTLVDDLFSFAGFLFPILIGLLALSGAAKSATVFSSFSVFLLETGSYLIRFVLLPLALSILFLSLFGSVFSKGHFSKLTSLFRQIFKYIFVVFFAVFGLMSTVNIISTTSHDGVNLKLTKFALKNYIPILGGYVSEGFDFIYSCSVLIKNAVGVCSIIIIIFKIIMPLVVVVVLSLCFKLLSVVAGLVGDGTFSNMFDDVSKAFSNFLSIILGMFLIVFVFVFLVVMSVGVVWLVELVVYIILLNIIFEFLQIICPFKKFAGMIRSFLSVLILYLVCLKIKNYF